jgi:hypothetical protein
MANTIMIHSFVCANGAKAQLKVNFKIEEVEPSAGLEQIVLKAPANFTGENAINATSLPFLLDGLELELDEVQA